jgi:hypothetical protein
MQENIKERVNLDIIDGLRLGVNVRVQGVVAIPHLSIKSTQS